VYSRAVTDESAFDLDGTLTHDGPLSRAAALASLDHAAELLAASKFVDAARLYQRVIGFDDPAVTAAALLGFGQAMHRLDDEGAATGAWEEVTRLPRTPATYPAWRELAGARVRRGDLAGAAAAYREADRLAPPEDKAEIAARLGWLSKELGDTRAAGRYFSRARGGTVLSMTIAIIAVTTIVSLVADLGGQDGGRLMTTLQLDKVAVAQGELYRLWTVALVHAPLLQDPFHLPFNMYALWLVGPMVERLYGRSRFLVMYLVFTLGASLMSFAMATAPDDRYAVGASGAIFGLFGVLVAATVVHRPADHASRGFVGQIVALILINLLIGVTGQGIDNWAHIGGLIAGLWLGVLILPTGVPTPRSMWMRPGPGPGTTMPLLGRGGMAAVTVAGIAALAVFFGLLWTIGLKAWS
jgi:membrane associated rhomboid family serine protease